MKADHPIWRWLTLVVCLIAVCTIIGLHAQKFNGDEISQFIWTILALGGAGGAYEWMRSRFKER